MKSLGPHLDDHWIEPGGHEVLRTLNYFFSAAIILTLLFSPPKVAQAQTPITETLQAAIQPTSTEIIDAINVLRLSYGLPALL